MAENDMDSLEHQTIPGLENYSIPRAKRNFVQRYSPIFQHWTGHPNYAANPVFAKLIKTPNLRYNNEYFLSQLKERAFDLHNGRSIATKKYSKEPSPNSIWKK